MGGDVERVGHVCSLPCERLGREGLALCASWGENVLDLTVEQVSIFSSMSEGLVGIRASSSRTARCWKRLAVRHFLNVDIGGSPKVSSISNHE